MILNKYRNVKRFENLWNEAKPSTCRTNSDLLLKYHYKELFIFSFLESICISMCSMKEKLILFFSTEHL